MSDRSTFHAPWTVKLTIMTVLCIVLLLGIPVIGLSTGPRELLTWTLSMVVMPLAMLAILSLFAIRGYVVRQDAIEVLRVGWKSTIDLADLKAVDCDPDAMARSIRTFGIGGMFCYAGAFRNHTLGSYRAFATDPKRAVVLRFSTRNVVVTPDDPQEFAARIRSLKGWAA